MTQETLPPNTPPVIPPPATPPAPNGGNTGEDEQPIMSTAKLKERLERAKDAERTRLFAELGIEDPAADAELLKAARKRKADEQSAAEAALEALGKEKAKREAAEQALADRNAEIEAKERAATRDNAVTKALTAANAKADKVLKLLRVDHAAELDAVLKDDGTVDEKQVTKLVETARKDYAEDFGTRGPGTGSHSGGRAAEPGSKDRESAAVATFNALRNRI